MREHSLLRSPSPPIPAPAGCQSRPSETVQPRPLPAKQDRPAHGRSDRERDEGQVQAHHHPLERGTRHVRTTLEPPRGIVFWRTCAPGRPRSRRQCRRTGPPHRRPGRPSVALKNDTGSLIVGAEEGERSLGRHHRSVPARLDRRPVWVSRWPRAMPIADSRIPMSESVPPGPDQYNQDGLIAIHNQDIPVRPARRASFPRRMPRCRPGGLVGYAARSAANPPYIQAANREGGRVSLKMLCLTCKTVRIQSQQTMSYAIR